MLRKVIKNLLDKYGDIISISNGGDIVEEELIVEQIITEIVDYYKSIIACMPGNVYWLDKNNRVVGANNNVLRMFNMSNFSELKGLNFEEMAKVGRWTSEATQSFKHDTEEVLKTKEPKLNIEEPPIPSSDGKMIYFLSSRVPLLDKNDHVLGVVGISIDITKEKEAEELAREKIIADRMIQTLKSLAGSLSHELRTPLAGIDLVMQSNGATIQSLMHFQEDVLAGREPWPVSQEGINALKAALPKIKHQLKNAEIIINLQLQSIHDKDVDTRLCAHHSIVNIIQSALDQYPFNESQRALVHFGDENDFTFWGESHLMLNVLYNLIKNALYFVQEAGKGEIFITFSSDDDYNYLHFKDTAQGMPLEIAVNVFEKFYTKTRHGTGLGLAFCQHVMRSFKGDIVCQSEEGKYAEFILSFPKLDKQENN